LQRLRDPSIAWPIGLSRRGQVLQVASQSPPSGITSLAGLDMSAYDARTITPETRP